LTYIDVAESRVFERAVEVKAEVVAGNGHGRNRSYVHIYALVLLGLEKAAEDVLLFSPWRHVEYYRKDVGFMAPGVLGRRIGI
jgi:hypothetical protein